MAVLKLCSNVETLALPGFFAHTRQRDVLRDFKKFMTSPRLSPRRLHIGSPVFPRDQLHLSHPIFHRVTHLEFLSKETISKGWDWSTLRCLVHLTHLSVYRPFRKIEFRRGAEEILAVCSQHLRVFILWVDLDFPPADDEVNSICSGHVDPRLVLGFADLEMNNDINLSPYTMTRLYDSLIYFKHVPQDGGLYRTRLNFWTKAEEIIENRNQAKSPVAHFSLSEFMILNSFLSTKQPV